MSRMRMKGRVTRTLALFVDHDHSSCGWSTRTLALMAFLVPTAVYPAENGVGVYLLGVKGPGAGVLPPQGTYFQNDLYFYSGSSSTDRQSQSGDITVTNVEADAVVNLTSVLWSTSTQVFGGNLAFSATLLSAYQDVSTNFTATDIPIQGDALAIGDPILGTRIGWRNGNLHSTAGTLVNLPIGDYDSDEFANVAFNRWAVDFFAGASYIDPATGWDFSGIAGVTFNGENKDTDYETGDEFHFEWAITKALSKRYRAGLTGYHYHQITGDSGRGAIFGDNKGRVSSVGLMASYNFQFGQTPVSLNAKYFSEFNTTNRLEGEALLITLGFPF